MKNKVKKIFASIVLVASIQGCGTGVDPLVLFDDSIPELGTIVSGTTVNGGLISPGFTSATPYWTINSAGFGVNSFTAPQRGIVTELTSTSITILHSGRISTKIDGLSSINIRVGDTVNKGQAIALFAGFSVVKFYVYLDGVSVCPMSFLEQAFRANLGSFNACQ